MCHQLGSALCVVWGFVEGSGIDFLWSFVVSLVFWVFYLTLLNKKKGRSLKPEAQL